jgi:hypothetical protein
MQYPLCRHIHTSGTRCGSPALASRQFCYFHQRLFDSHKTFRVLDPSRFLRVYGEHIELAPLEDRAAVQMALSLVINAIGTGQLDVKRANSMLYGLQLATMNLPRRGSLTPDPTHVVRAMLETPEGLDLAEPGALTADLDPSDTPTRQESPASATIEKLTASPRETH